MMKILNIIETDNVFFFENAKETSVNGLKKAIKREFLARLVLVYDKEVEKKLENPLSAIRQSDSRNIHQFPHL